MNLVILIGVLAHVVRLSNGDEFEEFLKLLQKLDVQTDNERCEDSKEFAVWTKGHGDDGYDYADSIEVGIICYICDKCSHTKLGRESPAVCAHCMVQKLDADTVTRSCVVYGNPLCSSDSDSCCSTDYCNSQQRTRMYLKRTVTFTVMTMVFISYTQ